MKTRWNKASLYALLLLVGSIGAIALFPMTDRLITLIQSPTPEYLLSLSGERQFLWTWYVHLLVSALASMAALYLGIVAARRTEPKQLARRWVAILTAIAAVLVLFTLVFSVSIGS